MEPALNRDVQFEIRFMKVLLSHMKHESSILPVVLVLCGINKYNCRIAEKLTREGEK
jgi:hypothetical protein